MPNARSGGPSGPRGRGTPVTTADTSYPPQTRQVKHNPPPPAATWPKSAATDDYRWTLTRAALAGEGVAS